MFTEPTWGPVKQQLLNMNRRSCPQWTSQTRPKGMLYVQGSAPLANWWLFQSTSTIMEGVTHYCQNTWKWEVAASEQGGTGGGAARGFGEQYPWEAAPQTHHQTRMYVKPFLMHEYLVTNEMFLHFLEESGLFVDRLATDHNFLRHWTRSPNKRQSRGVEDDQNKIHLHLSRTFERGAGRQPVRWVDPYEAQKFCEFYNLRLPHSWEWQWAARGINEKTFPRPKQRHLARADHETDFPNVDFSRDDAAPQTGIRNLWMFLRQYTDVFVDEYMARAVLKGGSFYSPYTLDAKKHGCPWCEQQPQSKEDYTSYLLGPRGVTRSALIGFRCVADIAGPPPTSEDSSPGLPTPRVHNCKLYGCDVANGGTRQVCHVCEPGFSLDGPTGDCVRALDVVSPKLRNKVPGPHDNNYFSRRSKNVQILIPEQESSGTQTQPRLPGRDFHDFYKGHQMSTISSSGISRDYVHDQEPVFLNKTSPSSTSYSKQNSKNRKRRNCTGNEDLHARCAAWASKGWCRLPKHEEVLRRTCCRSCPGSGTIAETLANKNIEGTGVQGSPALKILALAADKKGIGVQELSSAVTPAADTGAAPTGV